MALKKQLLSSPMVGNLDTKSNQRVVKFPNMLQMDNVIVNENGELEKRPGFWEYTNNGNETNAFVPRMLVSDNTNLISVVEASTTALYAHRAITDSIDTDGAAGVLEENWSERFNTADSVKVSVVGAAGSRGNSTSQFVSNADAAVHGFIDSNFNSSVMLDITDMRTNQIVRTYWDFSQNVDAFKLLASPNYIYLVVASTNAPGVNVTTTIGVYALTSEWVANDTPAISSSVTYSYTGGGTQTSINLAAGVCVQNNNEAEEAVVVVAGYTGAGTAEYAQVMSFYWDANYSGTPYNNLRGGTRSNISTSGNSKSLKVYTGYNTADPENVLPSSGVTVSDSTTFSHYAVSVNNTGIMTISSATAYGSERWPGGGTISKASGRLTGIGNPIVLNGRVYYFYQHSSTLQNCIFLAASDYVETVTATTWPRIAAKFLYTTYNSNFNSHCWPGSGDNSGTITIGANYSARVDNITALNDTLSVFYQPLPCAITITRDHDHQYLQTQLGQNLNISGGFVQEYDGEQVYENGFFLFPEGVTAVDQAAGALAAGDYTYKVIYEWQDGNGNVHRSATSPAVTVTLGASRQARVTYPNYNFGNRDIRQVKIGIYRTLVNESDVFYRVTTVSGSPTNVYSSLTSTYDDNNTDATIATHDTLYTSGGEVDSDASPPAAICIAAKNRLWAVDEWGKLWFSKEYIPGEGVGFSLYLQKTVPEVGGRITALGNLDDKLIVFKQDKIFAFAGNGPTPNAENDDFTLVAELGAKVGCAYPNTLVEYDDGLLFKSDRGFYLLDRGLNLTYFGEGVSSLEDEVIVSAVHKPDARQIWYFTRGARALIYNYSLRDEKNRGIWTTATLKVSADEELVDACMYQGYLHYIDSAGVLRREVPTRNTDDFNTEEVVMTIETGWFVPDSPTAWKRIYRAIIQGEFKSHHVLTVELYKDFSPYPFQTKTFTTTELMTGEFGEGIYGEQEVYGVGNSVENFQLRIAPEVQKVNAMKLKITDSTSAYISSDMDANGAAMSLHNIGFEIGITGQGTKLGADRSK